MTAAVGLERETADGLISSIEHDLLDAQAEIDRVNEEKVEIAWPAGKYWTMEYAGETTKLRYDGIHSQRSVIILKQ